MNNFKMKLTYQRAFRSNLATSLAPYKAFVYTIAACCFFSMNSILVRFTKGTPILQMSLYRFVGMLVFNLPIAIYKGQNLIGPRDCRWMLLYRAAAATSAVFCSFVSFRYLPIGEASVIVFSTPVFVTIFAKIFLKETCGMVQSVIVGLTVLGIILIINPSNLIGREDLRTTDHAIGVLFGIGALIGQCSMTILTRRTRSVHFSVVCFTTSALGTILCILLIGSVYNTVLPRCGPMRWVAVAIGLSASLGQVLYIKALQMENVGPTSTLKAAGDIIFAVSWQVVIFNESLDEFAISGTGLVIISVFFVGLRKWVLLLPKNSPVKHTLRLLTY